MRCPVALDALLGRGVRFPAEVLVEDLAEDRLAGGGAHEQRDAGAQLLRVEVAEDLLRGAALPAGEDGGAFGQPCAENRMPQVRPGLVQRGDRVFCDVGLKPRPAICGKTNHIQWLVLRPRRSSAAARS